MIRTVKHKGYTIQQTDYNNHYMIFNDNGEMVMHCSCTKKLNEDGLKEAIESFIRLSDSIKENDIRSDIK